jgi:maltooligosyltrehalose trehalohydrolase
VTTRPRPFTALGAHWVDSRRCRICVWAPRARTVAVHVVSPADRVELLEPLGDGYFGAEIPGLAPGDRYTIRLDGAGDFPDPASRSQPAGVHGPSELLADDFVWDDAAWCGHRLQGLVIYELHVGTFTPAGTFDAAAEHLASLRDLGVTAVEVMPIAQFPGVRNWGYDGVCPFAVQHSYGGAAGLKRFVAAAHAADLAVLVDVVYNHLGPEGNYLSRFGPYFTDRYHTPWGEALDFDGEQSAGVRRFVIENAVQWIRDFHVDGLRLDAVHSIFDGSATHVLTELTAAAHAAAPGRHVHVVAESDANDPRLVMQAEDGGIGVDAQWSDDFHHALHALLTGERRGYYREFGDLRQLARAFEAGFVRATRRPAPGAHAVAVPGHSVPAPPVPAERLVVCSQNHDQVGNRMHGERLHHLVSFEHAKLAACATMLSPNVPLLFMGQEYAERAPFLYFVDHSDPALVEAVRRGRRQEFRAFEWRGEVPDPQSPDTFTRSVLDHALKTASPHAEMLAFHREVLRLRRSVPALAALDMTRCEASCLEEARTLVVRRWAGTSEAVIVLAFGDATAVVDLPVPRGTWRVVLDSSDPRWLGPGRSVPDRAQSEGVVAASVRAGEALVLVREP